MLNDLGDALAGFNDALGRFRDALAKMPEVGEKLFSGTDEWANLLTYKLVPHLEAEGCLVVAVTGGTNTGKSTVFNLLVGVDASPVRNTAAATRHPVLAANVTRYRQCLAGRLMPEFNPVLLDDPESAITKGYGEETLFIFPAEALPNQLLFLDTPDVDSIEQQNWKVAKHIRAAGDVLIALLTPEKYKDERVIAFFREAHASGRLIVPVMNKANPKNEFEVARTQIGDFCSEVGLTAAACFALPHDFGIADSYAGVAITSLQDAPPLRDYLEGLDVYKIKERVYKDSVQHFTAAATDFLGKAGDTAAKFRTVVKEYKSRAATYAERYDPVPGAEVGGLFHAFVQSKRGPLDRKIGQASRAFAHGVGRVGRGLREALLRRATFEKPAEETTDDAILALHTEALEGLTRDLVTRYIESARNLRAPTDQLVGDALDGLDVDAVVDAVVQQTCKAESISKAFRAHAEEMLEAWWGDHRGRRKVILALDRVLLLAPAAIAGVMSVQTAGVGVAETMVVAGPLLEQFTARLVEYQFGDALFDFISPWRKEQRAAFEKALLTQVAHPALKGVYDVLEPLEGKRVHEMRSYLKQCQAHS